ncbi:hypothetical protein IFM89_010365 [Coptis chinensis]|uniref:Peptidoglycan binding-like domain-containing protein n=1 Tax=Coptis chinensis TaxID=261450 RepID=A0A835LVI5_9MAGN|nr:hypothetical protein IFM89_010365 [Coptis chinensis]
MKKRKNKRISSLRKGSEGVEVHAMQEALQNLGFYSGEEDMEFSSFLSGTERAVKTWQASLGACEDGIMTAELLEKLFMEQGAVDPNFHESTNGASVASVTEVLEIKQNVIKESEVAEFEASHHRVFLLGENRWEDSSRLVGRNKEVSASKNVMELANQISSCSFWNGLTREQNVRTVKALATTFAMYVKGKHISVPE